MLLTDNHLIHINLFPFRGGKKECAHINQRQIPFTQNSTLRSPHLAHCGRMSRNIWPTCVFLVHAATRAHSEALMDIPETAGFPMFPVFPMQN